MDHDITAGRRTSTRSKILDYLLAAVAVIAVALLALSYLRPVGASTPPRSLPSAAALVGKPLPPVAVMNTNGGLSTFEPVPDGRRSLVILFRVTCTACERTAPVWHQMLDRLGTGRVRVIAINLEDPTAAGAWLKRQGIAYDALILPTTPEAFVQAWHAEGVPLTVVLDEKGTVIAAQIGALTSSEESTIEHALRG